MSDRLLKESDVLRIAFQLPLVVNSAFANSVKALPSADRRQEWIPCSERLPRDYRTVLVTWEYAGKSYTATAFRETKNAVTYWASDDQPKYTPLNVVAWMPLPEPWKGADDESAL